MLAVSFLCPTLSGAAGLTTHKAPSNMTVVMAVLLTLAMTAAGYATQQNKVKAFNMGTWEGWRMFLPLRRFLMGSVVTRGPDLRIHGCDAMTAQIFRGFKRQMMAFVGLGFVNVTGLIMTRVH